jgi:CRISPR/Cas system-associated exonuclease Cas4 (RecB family)
LLKFAPYSYSRISTFVTCPRKFKYSYIDKIEVQKEPSEALIKGSAVHELLEHYPNNLPEHEKYKPIVDKFAETLIGKYVLNRKSMREFDFGLTADLKPCDYWAEECMFRGSIDCIITDDMLVLVDYKTGKYKDIKWQSFDQLMFYAIYFFKRYTLDSISIRYLYVEHDSDNSLILQRKYLNNYIKELMDNINNIESCEDFIKKESKLCDYCDYQEFCKQDI